MTVGQRLKRFRTRKNLTQKQLGLAVGFDKRTADIRIAQYESGTRKPKGQYTEKLAAAVGVQPSALDIQDIPTDEYLFQLLFAIEDEYSFKISKDENGLPCLSLGQLDKSGNYNSKQAKNYERLCAWYKKAELLKNGEITEKEYDDWRYNFPLSYANETHQALKNKEV